MQRVASAQILLESLARQRERAVLWAPVCFGTGVGMYFALPAEPSGITLGMLACVCAGLVGLVAFGARGPRPIFFLCALIIAGTLCAAWRAHSVAGPVIDWRYYGAVQGRIVALDRSHSGAVRMTLDRVHLDRVRPSKTPRHVRISLHGSDPQSPLKIGETVMTTAHLSPPNGPVEPHGFDFRRHAWFQQIGAFGYTRTPVLLWDEATPTGLSLRITALRQSISAVVLAQLPARQGALATAVTTGDRSAMDQQTLQDLRRSNLAHLLAISGLHMGLLTGVIFGAIRAALALIPSVSMRVPDKKIAAIGALCAGAFYLALSGGSVATERAFIMVSVMLCAVLVDRRALSLRAVALAAMVVLILRPEALVGPGFQMSFAATAALVWAFRAFADLNLPLPKWTRPILSVVLSSAVAGAATAPIAAAHFNQVVHFGLIANVLAVPVMGAIVIPGAVVAAVLWPLGLSWVGFQIMGLGCSWILGVAHYFGTLDNAVSGVAMPPPVVLPLIALGGVVFLLWKGRGAWAGPALGLVAAGFWVGTERPDVLIAASGGLIGYMEGDVRALSREKGSGFVAQNWLENDGHLKMSQAEAASLAQPDHSRVFQQIAGKRQAKSLNECNQTVIYIVNVKLEGSENCAAWSPDLLQKTGSLALTKTKDGWGLEASSEVGGNRLWSPQKAGTTEILRRMRLQLEGLNSAPPYAAQYVRINPTKRP